MRRLVIARNHPENLVPVMQMLVDKGVYQEVTVARSQTELRNVLNGDQTAVVVADSSIPELQQILREQWQHHGRVQPVVHIGNEEMAQGAMHELGEILEALAGEQRRVPMGVQQQQGPSPFDKLSPREREIARLMIEGVPNRAIAADLHISPRTVDTHRSNILKKLGARSNANLVMLAVQHGFA